MLGRKQPFLFSIVLTHSSVLAKASVWVGFIMFALFCPQMSLAEETASEAPPEAAERQTTNNSTEALNEGQGGVWGFGGQKPLKKVGGIPLPNNRSSRPVAGGVSGQSLASSQGSLAGPRDASPLVGARTVRRSKPFIDEVTTDFPARMVYLNGKNISSVREQQLNGVNVRIDAHGNVHILGAHYEVQESSHYRPLFEHEVPKLSKPSSDAEPPLIPGTYSKTSSAGRAEAAPSPSARESSPTAAPRSANQVPPVEGADSGGDESESAPRAETSAKDKSKASPQ
jgi:hypothetical protein